MFKKRFFKNLLMFVFAFALIIPVASITTPPKSAHAEAGFLFFMPHWEVQEIDAEGAADKIPNRLKSGKMKVDLGKFRDKYGNTPKTKSSGTFTDKNGDWYIEKDMAGHIGCNGEHKKWKIRKKDATKRTASLDKNGNVIDK
jgi:hypothetical protein